MNKAIFLDRDGTLIYDWGYLRDWRKIKFYRSVIPALKILEQSGFRLIIITNQSGLARGLLTVNQLHQIHRRLIQLLRNKGVKISAIYYCPHHPEENCRCRKPKTLLYQKARRRFQLDFSRSYVIGDKVSDIQAGKNIGAKTGLVLTGQGRKERKILLAQGIKPDLVAGNLLSVAKWIIGKNKALYF